MSVSIPGKRRDTPNLHFVHQDNLGNHMGIFANLLPMGEKITSVAGIRASHPVGFRIKLKLIHPLQVIQADWPNNDSFYSFHSPATRLPGSR